jgi:Arc/MetJ family transcription regulator
MKILGFSCAKTCAIKMHMATNLDIAQELLEEAVKIGNHRSKRAAVEAALKEYINRRKQKEVTQLFGKIDIDESYDHSAGRRSSWE